MLHPPTLPPAHLSVETLPEGRLITWLENNPGDYNLDGTVNGLDVFPLASRFGQKSNFNGQAITTKGNDCIDGNKDGVLNGLDLFTIATNFESQVSGVNLYRSTDGGSNWDFAALSPFSRITPQAQLCSRRFRYLEQQDRFIDVEYYAGAYSGEWMNMGDPTPVVDDGWRSVATITETATGGDQVVASPHGFRALFSEGTLDESSEIQLGYLDNQPDAAGLPLATQTFFVDLEPTAALATPYTVQIPWFDTDTQGFTPQELGVILMDAETPGDWTVLESADFELTVVDGDEGYIEFETSLPFIYAALYRGDFLEVTLLTEATEGEAPVSLGFSCVAHGGVPPYVYTWYLNGEPIIGEESYWLDYSFESRGAYELSVDVMDADGGSLSSDPVQVYISGEFFPYVTEVYTHSNQWAMEPSLKLRFDSAGNPTIAAYDWGGDLYCLEPGETEWEAELIQSPVIYFDFAIDNLDRPVIAYTAMPNQDLLVKVRHEGEWELVHTIPGRVICPSIALSDSGEIVIAYCLRDSQLMRVTLGDMALMWEDYDIDTTFGVTTGYQRISATWGEAGPDVFWGDEAPERNVRQASFRDSSWETLDIMTMNQFSSDSWLSAGYDPEGDMYVAVAEPTPYFCRLKDSVWDSEMITNKSARLPSAVFPTTDRPLVAFASYAIPSYALNLNEYTGSGWEEVMFEYDWAGHGLDMRMDPFGNLVVACAPEPGETITLYSTRDFTP